MRSLLFLSASALLLSFASADPLYAEELDDTWENEPRIFTSNSEFQKLQFEASLVCFPLQENGTRCLHQPCHDEWPWKDFTIFLLSKIFIWGSNVFLVLYFPFPDLGLNNTVDARALLAALLLGILFALVLGYSFLGEGDVSLSDFP